MLQQRFCQIGTQTGSTTPLPTLPLRAPVCRMRSVSHCNRRNLSIAQAAQTEAPADVSVPSASTSKPEPTGRIARLQAEKQGGQPVKELQRALAEYMALPASQYSVLDARMIERLDDSTFRCYVGQLKIFNWSAEPVLTVSVSVEPGGCTIRLLSCEIKGSPLVEDINRKFTAQMVNVVRWRETSQPDEKEIMSMTTLQVVLQVPAWCGFLPTASIESVGSSVLQNVLNVMVPRFLKQLETDYSKWATGISRQPIN